MSFFGFFLSLFDLGCTWLSHSFSTDRLSFSLSLFPILLPGIKPVLLLSCNVHTRHYSTVVTDWLTVEDKFHQTVWKRNGLAQILSIPLLSVRLALLGPFFITLHTCHHYITYLSSWKPSRFWKFLKTKKRPHLKRIQINFDSGKIYFLFQMKWNYLSFSFPFLLFSAFWHKCDLSRLLYGHSAYSYHWWSAGLSHLLQFRDHHETCKWTRTGRTLSNWHGENQWSKMGSSVVM